MNKRLAIRRYTQGGDTRQAPYGRGTGRIVRDLLGRKWIVLGGGKMWSPKPQHLAALMRAFGAQ